MKKLIYLLLSVVLFTLTIQGVIAYVNEGLCFPDQEMCGVIVDGIEEKCKWNGNFFEVWADDEENIRCDKILKYKYDCTFGESKFLAKRYIIQPVRDAYGNVLEYGYYADIDYVVYCPNGCDKTANKCIGENGHYVPQCSEGDQTCGNIDEMDSYGNIPFDIGGSPLKCVNGQWEWTDRCYKYQTEEMERNGEYVECELTSWGEAKCNLPEYYCHNINSAWSDCSTSSIKMPGCYETLAECESTFPYWCAKPGTGECVKRLGGCLANERSFKEQGNADSRNAYRSCVESGWQCYKDDDCPAHFECKSDKCTAMPNQEIPEPSKFDSFVFGVQEFFKKLGWSLAWLSIVIMIVVGIKYLHPILRSVSSLGYYLIVGALVLLIYLLYLKLKHGISLVF